MILSIRTEKPEAEIGLHKDGEQLDYHTWAAHRELSNTLLQKIHEMLERSNLSSQNLEGVVVYKGPGSFTGLRIGITVANTLGYSLGIPVVAAGGENWIGVGSSRIQAGENDKIAMPEYGGEANITQPRK